MQNKILQKLQGADKILIGIGGEFEEKKLFSTDENKKILEKLRQNGLSWAIPALYRSALEKNAESPVREALAVLAKNLQDKDYFVVTSLTNDILWDSRLDQKRIVAPCGGSRMKQCSNGCPEALTEVGEAELRSFTERMKAGENCENVLGTCPKCGGALIFNNIYANHYNENGYQEQWINYMQWLKGTLNRKLCVLELGVGMEYPTIIRWPFEKTVFLNQKAVFIRVNERLFQLPEELSGKGISVQANAPEWLLAENDIV